MAETKDLIKLIAVTDFDTPMYHVGEVDFRYSPDILREHIEKHGAKELLHMLSYMTHIVWSIEESIQRERQRAEANSA